ncbi:MgtC/SapB family protein [Ferrovibrio sp.]|uniref:MgtC/SapB family protein n=1 Tax=Ferrovibrio sp. TaxID=1917215 RepID=UPI000CB71722|nr:MgtC/SapB family protein [Ferrovibrio sp.]PJI43388.1 MAG: hypothetical protein CTR53_03735 [Ferrovibrio sp.]
MIDPEVIHFVTALGIGLLIGAERERRKGARSPAGIRTFTLAALAGATGQTIGGDLLLAMVVGITALFCAVAYYRQMAAPPAAGETDAAAEARDADRTYGLTSEIALVLTVLLGGLCLEHPALAAGVGVTTAVLLAARRPMHAFVRHVLTTGELRDALIFAASTLVILPLLPNQAMGPFAAFNPAKLWIVVILVMAIGAIGYIAIRLFGAKYGMVLAGFAGGFISSTATIGAMGQRARKAERDRSAAVAGAVLSTVATVGQMALVLAATSLPVLRQLAIPLALAGIAALAYGAIFTIAALREAHESGKPPGRAFRLSGALVFAGILAIMLFASAALQHVYGDAGVLVAAMLAGFADTHAPAISVASLQIEPQAAALPILAAFSTNSISKAVFAWIGGGAGYALRVIPGLVLVAVAAWCGLLLV